MLIGTSTAQALQAQRALYTAQNEIKTSSERMSTGIRINHAADDAAGLAISNSMHTKILSSTAASRNVNDAISSAQIADGGIEELSTMVQRLRELAVQAASDLYTSENRNAMQIEASHLLTEINAVTSRTSMNTFPLLDGTFNKDYTIGVDGESANLSINGLDAIDLGLVDEDADKIKASLNNFNNIVGQTINFSIEGVSISFAAAGTADQQGNASVLKSALDAKSGLLSAAGVSYQLNSAGTGIELTMDSAVGGTAIDIDNYSITQDLLAMEASGAITAVQATNGDFESGLTGWNANTNFSGLPGDTPSGTPTQTTTIDSTTSSTGSSSLKMTINGSVTVGYGTAHGPEVTSDVFSAKAGDLLAVDWKALNSGDDYDIYLYIENVDTGEKQQVIYQRGDFQNWTSITATIPFTGENLRFSFLGGSYDATGGTVIGSTLYIDNVRTLPKPDATMDVVEGSNEIGSETLSDSNADTAIQKRNNYNLVTAEFAMLSITACDYALDMLSTERAKIGAFQNRMEHTSSNLHTMRSNLSAAHSRIEDTDYAVESANLAKANIIRQSSMSMLSQANQQQNMVLQLLKEAA